MDRTDANVDALMDALGVSEGLAILAADLRRVADGGGLALTTQAVQGITHALDHFAQIALRLEKGHAPDMDAEEAQEQVLEQAFFSGIASGKLLLHPVLTRGLPQGQSGGAA